MGDIQTLQQKLIQLNITVVGTPDGKFGKNTTKAILIFKKEYDRSTACDDTLAHYNSHGLNWKQEKTEDSTVERNCIMALDEAIVSGWKYSGCSIKIDKFIEEYKKVHSIYDSKSKKFLKMKLNEKSENYLKKLLQNIITRYKQVNKCSIPQVSYMLATVKIETYNYLKGILFFPISELGGDKYAERMYDPILGMNSNRIRIAKELGNISKGDGAKYKGRGFVQITGKTNYQTFSKKLNLPLVMYPEKTLEWNISFEIMFIGMMDGLFTGKKLDNYITETNTNYYDARRIINGTNKASVIKKYAEEFEKCLELARQ